MTRPRGVHVVLLVALVGVWIAYLPLNRDDGATAVLYTSLDRRLPVVPLLAVPYVAFLPLYWATVLRAFAQERHFLQLAVAGLIVGVVSAAIYLLAQTSAPRPSVTGTDWASDLLRYVYAHDRPYNDVPSGHAASATLFALYHARCTAGLGRAAAILFAASVIGATVLIKQHSIAGAVAGACLADVAWIVAARRLSVPRSPQSRT